VIFIDRSIPRGVAEAVSKSGEFREYARRCGA